MSEDKPDLDREGVRREYGALFDEVSAALFETDPMGIAFGDRNRDEYDPEAGTILPRLRACQDESDARRVIFEEFARWFGTDLAGDERDYADAAAAVWPLWLRVRVRLRLPG